MKILRRSFFSLVVAALTLATLALVAHAGYYVYIDDGTNGFTTSGSIWNETACSFSTCQGGDARRGSSNNGAVGYWTTYTANITGIDTWIPNPISGTYAAVKYHVYSNNDDFLVTVNQNNWKGRYVYLGYLGWPGSWAQIVLPTSCVPGYSCGGSMPVYYDLARFWVP